MHLLDGFLSVKIGDDSEDAASIFLESYDVWFSVAIVVEVEPSVDENNNIKKVAE